MKEPGTLDTWLSRTTAAATLAWMVVMFTTDAALRAPWWFIGLALAIVVMWAAVFRQDAHRWQEYRDAYHEREEMTNEEWAGEYPGNLRKTAEEKDDETR